MVRKLATRAAEAGRAAWAKALARGLAIWTRWDPVLAPFIDFVIRCVDALRQLWSIRLIMVAWRRFGEDNSFALSGYLAYTGLLSFFPFFFFLVITSSYVFGLEASITAVNEIFAVAPEQVRVTLLPILTEIIEARTGFVALISAAVGLWAGSNAFEAARIGFNMAYDVRENRNFVMRRLQSLVLATAAAIVFMCLSFLIVLWPLLAKLIVTPETRSLSLDLFYILRYAIGLPMFSLLLVALHLTLPKGRRQGYQLLVRTEHKEDWTISVLPGVVASTVIWFLAATAFSMYLRFAPSFGQNYGAMAGVVITLLFFYMSAVVIFFGAQINIAREELRRNRTVKGDALAGEFLGPARLTGGRASAQTAAQSQAQARPSAATAGAARAPVEADAEAADRRAPDVPSTGAPPATTGGSKRAKRRKRAASRRSGG